MSKVFEKIVYNQIHNSIKYKLSNLLTGFRKNHSTWHCLKRDKLNKEGYLCAMFIDLSKVFDTLNYNLWIAKLGDYGFERK